MSLKKIGIVGGTAWQSTVHYYSLICRGAQERFGVTPEFTIESLDLKRAVSLIGRDEDEGSWHAFDTYHRDALQRVVKSGCDIVCFAANTPHHRFEAITRGVNATVVSIMTALAEAARNNGLDELVLLGTTLTMTSEPICRVFSDAGVRISTPSREEQAHVVALIERLQRGSDGDAKHEIARIASGRPAILGCTELALAFPEEIGSAIIDGGRSIYLNSLALHAAATLARSAEQASLVPRQHPFGASSFDRIVRKT